MKVLGFNFTKLSAERFKGKGGQAQINTNVDITELTQPKTDLQKLKEQVIEVEFNYSVLYEPKLASIIVQGVALIALEPKLAEETMKMWKSRKMPDDVRTFIVNTVMKKSTVKAILLCDELNLPLHVPLPILRKADVAPKKA